MLLVDVRQLQARVRRLLMSGRLRPRPERQLLRVNGDVLAPMSLLLSELRPGPEADQYGNVAKAFPREAGAKRGHRVVRARDERSLAPRLPQGR